MRFKAFLRGLLLYNTVYWRRASDAVDRRASRVTRAERERSRPQVDPEVLRPRALPRANSSPARDPLTRPLPPRAVGPTVFPPPSPAPPTLETSGPLSLPPEAERRRRRVMRRKQSRTGVDPTRVFSALQRGTDTAGKRKGWLKRLFGGS